MVITIKKGSSGSKCKKCGHSMKNHRLIFTGKGRTNAVRYCRTCDSVCEY